MLTGRIRQYKKKNTTKNKKIDDAVVCLSFAKYVEIAI